LTHSLAYLLAQRLAHVILSLCVSCEFIRAVFVY